MSWHLRTATANTALLLSPRCPCEGTGDSPGQVVLCHIPWLHKGTWASSSTKNIPTEGWSGETHDAFGIIPGERVKGEGHHVTTTLPLWEGRGWALCVSLSSATASRGAAQGPPFPSHPISITATSPSRGSWWHDASWMPEPGLALQSPRLALDTAHAGDSDAPCSALDALGEEGHMAPPTPPAVSMKGNGKERGININKLLCTERLSLTPQPPSTQRKAHNRVWRQPGCFPSPCTWAWGAPKPG